jgi:hypothetical protein
MTLHPNREFNGSDCMISDTHKYENVVEFSAE